MDRIQAFEDYYISTLVPLLREADRHRRRLRRKSFGASLKYLLLLLATIGVAFLVNRWIYGSWVHAEKANVPLIVLVFALFAIVFYWRRALGENKESFVESFKQNIIEKIVLFVDERLEYHPDKCISNNIFVASHLFSRQPDSYYGDDCVTGTIGDTHIIFSEVHARYLVETRDSDGKADEKLEKIFDGLFFKGDFNKDFKGAYFIFTEKSANPFKRRGFFNRKKGDTVERIKLEDPEFNRQFYVYGTDPVEAQHILSTSMRNRLLDFKRKTGKKIRVSLVNSSIYIAIPYKKELFEPKYYSSVVNRKDTMAFYRDLTMAVDIVKELDLNTL